MIKFWSVVLALCLPLFSGHGADAMAEDFTAEIAGMPCSLSLVTRRGKLVVKQSSIQCITNQLVIVPSVVVINDNTEHVFELKLRANKKRTKLLSGTLESTPKNVNLATKTIQHKGPEDYSIVDCTYEDPMASDWTKCQTTGIRTKTLNLIEESSPGGCLKFSTMSEKCEGGSRGYKKNLNSTKNVPMTSSRPERKKKIEDSGIAVGRYKISVPTQAIENLEMDDMDIQSFSSGTIVEGDIIVSSNQQTNRNALLGDSYRWPGNTLYYQFDSSVSAKQRKSINIAIGLLQSELAQCIKFEQRNSGNRVIVEHDDGCNSYVGYQNGIQDMHLGSGCIDKGTIQHEFLHAIGLEHHHSRYDRNKFVDIHFENIEDEFKFAFKRYSLKQVAHYGLDYDYLSVMHYGRKAFSKNDKDTITAKDSLFTDKLGQQDGASLGDVQLVQRHYDCPVVIQWKGKWGSFAQKATFCPPGSFVYGYRLRSQEPQGSGDDTALNDIELYCRRTYSNIVTGKIWSYNKPLGSWSPDKYCSGWDNPVVGFDVLEEGPQGSGDDTALNAVDLYCIYGYISASVKTHKGRWKPIQRCPNGFAVMGIRTQVEFYQGSGDDSAMNGVELYCKQYP